MSSLSRHPFVLSVFRSSVIRSDSEVDPSYEVREHRLKGDKHPRPKSIFCSCTFVLESRLSNTELALSTLEFISDNLELTLSNSESTISNQEWISDSLESTFSILELILSYRELMFSNLGLTSDFIVIRCTKCEFLEAKRDN